MFFRNPETAKRESWIYFIIVIIWSFFIGSTVWRYSQRIVNDITSISKIPVIEKFETVDWKTYKNEEYGFEVQYPGDWYNKVEIPSDTQTKLMVGFANYPLEEELEKEDRQLIILGVEERSITQWLEEGQESGVKIEEIEIDLKKGYKATSSGFVGGKFMTGAITVVVDKNNHLYFLFIMFPNTIGEKVFNQMLSTFKFLD